MSNNSFVYIGCTHNKAMIVVFQYLHRCVMVHVSPAVRGRVYILNASNKLKVSHIAIFVYRYFTHVYLCIYVIDNHKTNW